MGRHYLIAALIGAAVALPVWLITQSSLWLLLIAGAMLVVWMRDGLR